MMKFYDRYENSCFSLKLMSIICVFQEQDRKHMELEHRLKQERERRRKIRDDEGEKREEEKREKKDAEDKRRLEEEVN